MENEQDKDDQVTTDLFEMEEGEKGGFAWPCWACKHRDTPIQNAPCRRCEHYAN